MSVAYKGVFMCIQAHMSVHRRGQAHTGLCVHYRCTYVHPGTRMYLVANSPLGEQPRDGCKYAVQGEEEREEKGGEDRESWRQVDGEVGLHLGTPEGTVAPLLFLETLSRNSFSGQLESSLFLGLRPPAKVFRAKKMPFVLSDGVSW